MSLKYSSNECVEVLRNTIADNLDRYRRGNFHDILAEQDSAIDLPSVRANLAGLSELNPSGRPEDEVTNSLIVWSALPGMTPSLAYEEGIWVRLSHVECLEYSRHRWLTQPTTGKLVEAIETHLFANTLTKRRDDHSISRLWWNAYAAHKIDANDMRVTLNAMLKTADIRANIIERSNIGSRSALSAGIVRNIINIPAISSTEAAFRSFMRAVNKLGGGQVMEALSASEIDEFLMRCHEAASPA